MATLGLQIMTAQAVPPLMAPLGGVAPAADTGWLSGLFSAVGGIAKLVGGVAEHPATQTIAQTVYQWKELDLRKEAQKAQESLWQQLLGAVGRTPQIGQTGTPPIVPAGSIQAVPVPVGEGGMNWLIPVAIVAGVVLLARRK